jgi:hypothetical protein
MVSDPGSSHRARAPALLSLIRPQFQGPRSDQDGAVPVPWSTSRQRSTSTRRWPARPCGTSREASQCRPAAAVASAPAEAGEGDRGRVVRDGGQRQSGDADGQGGHYRRPGPWVNAAERRRPAPVPGGAVQDPGVLQQHRQHDVKNVAAGLVLAHPQALATRSTIPSPAHGSSPPWPPVHIEGDSRPLSVAEGPGPRFRVLSASLSMPWITGSPASHEAHGVRR